MLQSVVSLELTPGHWQKVNKFTDSARNEENKEVSLFTKKDARTEVARADNCT